MPNKNHRLPVGKAMMLGLPILATGKTIAIFDADQVPEGCDLYVQPKDSRLSLELEVANENAAHHQAECVKRGNRLHRQRSILRATALLLGSGVLDYKTPEDRENASKLAFMIEQELG